MRRPCSPLRPGALGAALLLVACPASERGGEEDAAPSAQGGFVTPYAPVPGSASPPVIEPATPAPGPEPTVFEEIIHEPVVHEPVFHEPVFHEPVFHEPVVPPADGGAAPLPPPPAGPTPKVWMPSAGEDGEVFVVLGEEEEEEEPPPPTDPDLRSVTVLPPSHMRLLDASAVRLPRVADYVPVRLELQMRCPRSCFVQAYAKAWEDERWQVQPMEKRGEDRWVRVLNLSEAAARGPVQWYIEAVDDRARRDGLYSRALPARLELPEAPRGQQRTRAVKGDPTPTPEE